MAKANFLSSLNLSPFLTRVVRPPSAAHGSAFHLSLGEGVGSSSGAEQCPSCLRQARAGLSDCLAGHSRSCSGPGSGQGMAQGKGVGVGHSLGEGEGYSHSCSGPEHRPSCFHQRARLSDCLARDFRSCSSPGSGQGTEQGTAQWKGVGVGHSFGEGEGYSRPCSGEEHPSCFHQRARLSDCLARDSRSCSSPGSGQGKAQWKGVGVGHSLGEGEGYSRSCSGEERPSCLRQWADLFDCLAGHSHSCSSLGSGQGTEQGKGEGVGHSLEEGVGHSRSSGAEHLPSCLCQQARLSDCLAQDSHSCSSPGSGQQGTGKETGVGVWHSLGVEVGHSRSSGAEHLPSCLCQQARLSDCLARHPHSCSGTG
jgi:hypothetical protein